MTELALATEMTAEQREYLLMAKGSAEVLLALINEILDFSKIEAGRLELEVIDMDVRNCIGDTMKSLAVRAAEKGLELAYRVRADVPRRLRGDPTRLRQVIRASSSRRTAMPLTRRSRKPARPACIRSRSILPRFRPTP